MVTVTDVRNFTGAPETLISNQVIESFITDIEKKSKSYFGIETELTKKIEILDGTGKESIRLNNPFPLKILELKLGNDNVVDLNNTQLELLSSILTLNRRQNPYYFYNSRNYVKVKYLSAFLSKSNISTESTNDITSGTSVNITIEDDVFSNEEVILIEDMDGKVEACTITSVSSGSITVDDIKQDHNSGAVITKLEVNTLFNDFILYEVCLAVSQYAVGSTYTFNTGWSKDGVSIQKGVPYTHWDKSSSLSEKRRNEIKTKIWNLLNPMY